MAARDLVVAEGCGTRIDVIVLDELPGGMPAACVQYGSHVCFYVSRAYPLDVVAAALSEVATANTQSAWVGADELGQLDQKAAALWS